MRHLGLQVPLLKDSARHDGSPDPEFTPRPRTVALIPAYNEQRFIGSLVLTARSYVDQVIVVDDGSKDATVAIARRAGAITIEHQQNQGKAAAINTGFAYLRHLGPEAVVMLDGDGQHSADEIAVLLAPILADQADIVVGSRFLSIKSAIPLYRQIGQHGLNVATNLASGVAVSDSQSGYRAFSRQALERLFFSQGGFSIESEMQFLIGEHGLRVAEVPISVVYAEKAKRNPVRHGLQVLGGILRLVNHIRPMLFFGFAGMLAFLLGAALGLYVVDIHWRTGSLAMGYSLLTVLLCVVGVVLIFAGVILQTLRGMLTDLRRLVLSRAAE
jgi:glycosyltransferase involved in cell wall biosynthesis